MPWLKADYSQDLYHRELAEIVEFGNPVDVRGRKTLEVMNFVTEVNEPWHHCILIPSRRWNPWLAMSEALWILAGRNDVAALYPYNKNIMQYSDDGLFLYGAYGKRIFNQIDPMLQRLKEDDSDRRAVLQIWQMPDLVAKTKDPPCNDFVMFKIRDGKLHMTVMNRSNDIHYGLFAVNLPTFGILQAYLAARLQVQMGHQLHFSDSLHLYTDDKVVMQITERMLLDDKRPRHYPLHDPAFDCEDFEYLSKLKHPEFASWCSEVLDGKTYRKAWPPFLKFARGFLRAYREKDLKLLPVNLKYSDWLEAAHMFADQAWK